MGRWTALLAVGLCWSCHAILPLGTAPEPSPDLSPGDISPADGPRDGGGPDRADGPGIADGPGDGPTGEARDQQGESVPCSQMIGVACTSNAQCGTQATCQMYQPGKGACGCACLPDDPQSPTVNEDSCPDLSQNVCIPGPSGGNYCARRCAPRLGANDCTLPLACAPAAMAFTGTSAYSACIFHGCPGASCPVYTGVSCSSSSPCPTTGESCLDHDPVSGKGRCAKPGPCDKPSGLCAPRYVSGGHAIGDPCKTDAECPLNGFCMMQFNPFDHGYKNGGKQCTSDLECCSKSCKGGICEPGACLVRYRNGYCVSAGCAYAATLNEAACPTGSSCNLLYRWLGGLCLKSCTLESDTDCRGEPGDLYGDYECRAWNNIYFYNEQVAATPVCEWGPQLPCSFWKTTSLDCGSVGNAPVNTTQMKCKTLDGKDSVDPQDPHGFCLDSTKSGGAFRSPLPLP